MLTTPYTHVVALKITLFMIKLHVPIYVYGYTYKGNRQDCTLRFVEILDTRQIIITLIGDFPQYVRPETSNKLANIDDVG